MAVAKDKMDNQNETAQYFKCQRCGQPLALDPTLYSPEDQLLAELSSQLVADSQNDDTLTLVPTSPKTGSYSSGVMEVTARKYVPPAAARLLTESGNGFLVVGESSNNGAVTENIGHTFHVASRLFDLMSEQAEIDHPLCEECTDTLLDQLDLQLRMTEDECKEYSDFLKQLLLVPSEENESSLQEELGKLQEEEAMLTQQLSVVERERAQVTEELEQQRQEKQRLDSEEESYWREYCQYKEQLLTYEDEQRSVENQLCYAQIQLDKLKKTNVFNATFHIWHSGQFGTINNFRLGRLPSVPVDWHEINAAWGQTVLLLHSLAKKLNLTFQRYRLVPYGNHSHIESLSDKSKELPLYGSGGIRFLWDTKFDQAMVAFLDCLQQFKEEAEKGDPGFCLPYKMDKGKIEDSSSGNSYSIKIQFNSEEQWTKALKFMLTNLKWGLAWVSSQFVKG